jgi:hypothetical protein
MSKRIDGLVAVALLGVSAGSTAALTGCSGAAVQQDRQAEMRQVTPVSVCRAKLAPLTSTVAAQSAVRELEPAQWLSVLVPAYDDESGIEPTSLDCTGNYVFANESLRGGASTRGWPRVLDPDELTIAAGPNGMRVLWLRGVRFENGEEGGPLALARAQGDAAEIYGVGSFRGPVDSEFVTARVGNDTIVVATTKECVEESGTCRKRGYFFLPRRGRLIEGAVVDLERTELVPSTTARGLYAEYQLNTDVTYQKDGILLLEQVAVRIQKSEVPELDSDRELRTVEFARLLKFERDSVFSSNEPLWERVVGRD